jgi:hypothetical protein
MGASRLASLSTQAYREALALLTQDVTVEAIISFRFSEEVEQRISHLLEQNREAQLTQAEQVDFERLSQLEEQMQLVKANALLKLSKG